MICKMLIAMTYQIFFFVAATKQLCSCYKVICKIMICKMLIAMNYQIFVSSSLVADPHY